ncbi:bifunctional diguanylate cyclase/phosphodiesterase [Actimicrobium antarcticum]|uniref:Diguanylate cyclase n=1 Tax=Actimicrobium antarcticum TaxID=1051899 RepID=A0ABP7TEL8_9BURK
MQFDSAPKVSTLNQPDLIPISPTMSAELEKTCAQEKIHLLGAVQGYGFLMVVDPASERIVQLSSGMARHWPGLPAASALIGSRVSDWIEGIDTSAALTTDLLPASHPVVRSWRPRFERTGSEPALSMAASGECLVHRSGAMLVLEWLPHAAATDEPPGHPFPDITAVIARLRETNQLDSFFAVCAEVVQQVSGFDRVMMYRFLPDGSGEVVAENTSGECEARFMGLRFPVTDIPSQARALYLANRLRVLVDVEAVPDTLVPALLPDGGPLDQSHCLLRSMSEVHLTYLRNMGVRATLTLSIVCDGKLWGLIACHHHAPKGLPQLAREGLREVCELIAEVTGMRILALNQIAALQHRLEFIDVFNRLRLALVAGAQIATALDDALPELLTVFEATGFGVRIGNVDYVGGPDTRGATAKTLLDEVATRLGPVLNMATVTSRDDLLVTEKQPFRMSLDVAGLMLAQGPQQDAIFCFLTRQEVVRQVRWGGDPNKLLVSLPDGTRRLEPRSSFAEWLESVQGQSQPWQQADGEALEELLHILGDMNHRQTSLVLQKKLHWRAHHDSLTGLYNRRAMEDEVSRRLELGETNAVLMLVDLDYFKEINDTHGHAAGDQVLQQLSSRLESVIREFDLLSRLGGDEFLLLLQLQEPTPDLAMFVAERLHQAVAPPFEVNSVALDLRISVGIAIPPGHGNTMADLLRRADLALYQAKSLGRSRSVVFDPALESGQADRYRGETDPGTR